MAVECARTPREHFSLIDVASPGRRARQLASGRILVNRVAIHRPTAMEVATAIIPGPFAAAGFHPSGEIRAREDPVELAVNEKLIPLDAPANLPIIEQSERTWNSPSRSESVGPIF